jgi:predicted phage-related endonuclease
MAGYELDMNDFNNEMDKILAKNNLPDDLLGINQAIDATQADIQAAVLSGNAEQLIELDNRMRILMARQFGADVVETKKLIDTAESEKISIAKELEIKREIKKLKNLAAGRAEMLFHKRMEKVQAAAFQIELAENRLTNARVLSRESKTKLQALLDAKQKETSRQYERYELSKY